MSPRPAPIELEALAHGLTKPKLAKPQRALAAGILATLHGKRFSLAELQDVLQYVWVTALAGLVEAYPFLADDETEAAMTIRYQLRGGRSASLCCLRLPRQSPHRVQRLPVRDDYEGPATHNLATVDGEQRTWDEQTRSTA
jgi:hypothetical protein